MQVTLISPSQQILCTWNVWFHFIGVSASVGSITLSVMETICVLFAFFAFYWCHKKKRISLAHEANRVENVNRCMFVFTFLLGLNRLKVAVLLCKSNIIHRIRKRGKSSWYFETNSDKPILTFKCKKGSSMNIVNLCATTNKSQDVFALERH